MKKSPRTFTTWLFGRRLFLRVSIGTIGDLLWRMTTGNKSGNGPFTHTHLISIHRTTSATSSVAFYTIFLGPICVKFAWIKKFQPAEATP